jgi:hypothetical protein
MNVRCLPAVVGVIAATITLAVAGVATGATPSAGFVARFNHVQTLGSTVPKSGGVNPYGIAVVPASKGSLKAGDILVSNFNNKKNLQGTGTTIMQISPKGRASVFATLAPSNLHGSCPGGVGLTTALAVLKSGWVIVGSLPTTNGMSKTAKAGCLILVNSSGRAVKTIFGGAIAGPWDMTAVDQGGKATLFVTNVLNGTVAASPKTVLMGTVVRIGLSTGGSSPSVTSETVIGNGFPERTDPGSLVVGPTGVALGPNGTLYVANSVANKITAISSAMTRTHSTRGTTVSSAGNLNDPLGLAIAPGGDILEVNGADGNLIELTPGGTQIAVKMLDTSPVPPGLNGNGTLFGLVPAPGNGGIYFVDDGTNTLNILRR